MKIEFGFQANCSEMISVLTFPDLDPLKEAMARIQELMNCWWWFRDPESGRSWHLPAEHWDSLLEFDPGRGTFGVNYLKYRELGDSVFSAAHGDIPWHGPADSEAADPFIRWEWFTLRKEPPNGSTRPEGSPLYRDFWKCGFDREKGELRIELEIENTDQHMYPLYHLVRREFGGGINDEGYGGSGNYERWMLCHFDRDHTQAAQREDEIRGLEWMAIRDERKKGFLRWHLHKQEIMERIRGDLPEKADPLVEEWMERHSGPPPLPDSPGLTESERNRLRDAYYPHHQPARSAQ